MSNSAHRCFPTHGFLPNRAPRSFTRASVGAVMTPGAAAVLLVVPGAGSVGTGERLHNLPTRPGGMVGWSTPPPPSHLPVSLLDLLPYVSRSHFLTDYERNVSIARPCSQSTTNSETGGYPGWRRGEEQRPTV